MGTGRKKEENTLQGKERAGWECVRRGRKEEGREGNRAFSALVSFVL
jgi:hypothetical protein